MSDFTTPTELIDALSKYFLPQIFQTEDFQSFEAGLTVQFRSLAAKCMSSVLEQFDQSLVANKPQGWTIHAKEKRTLLTLVGRVEFVRTCFKDEFGRRRLLADELLGIPERGVFSQGAFLWIATQAAELSYRKTAKAFLEQTGASISHVSVMRVVHTEGKLIKDSKAIHTKISTEKLCLETDGVWIHLQNPKHRKHALPRSVYELARQAQSFELKVACLYAGKIKEKGRTKRLGVSVSCSDSVADQFWEHVFEMICDDFEEQDIKHIIAGSDGATWCSGEHLSKFMSRSVQIEHHLDLFHLMQAITKAFPKGSAREKARQLAFLGKARALSLACKQIATRLDESTRKRRLRELAVYCENHRDEISACPPSLGTMEGTIAHVVAARTKGQGRSWSRAGAEAMVLIRCRIASGKPLVAPVRNPFFTEQQLQAKETYLSKLVSSSVPLYEGHGWDYPYQVNTQSLSTAARYVAHTE
ncbi:MAG: UPF0236 family protein [Atopobiaceae bacterium]|nr:UPF0236 family protein [Atopobiaceae bacterium]